MPGLNFVLNHQELGDNDGFINMGQQRPTFDIGQEKEVDLTGTGFNEFGIDQPELLCPKQQLHLFSFNLFPFLSTCLSFFALLARGR